MKTLADIISAGNAATDAGNPLVTNWPQARGALMLFGHRTGGLDQTVAGFVDRYPEDFDALAPLEQAAFGGAQVYQNARREVVRVLAVVGTVDDPWERLRVLIRQAGRSEDIENGWYRLRRSALDAGLAPSELRADWVWSLEAEAAGGLQRQALRRAVTLFNELFDISTIAASGLLPPEPIGPHPVYDRMGRRHVDLPPKLAHYQSCKPQQGLPGIWRALCAAGTIDLPEDPTADDLFATDIWARIAALPQSVTHHTEGTWRMYLRQARSTLLPHATLPPPAPPQRPETLPPHFVAWLSTVRDRTALNTLWAQITSTGNDALMEASAAELLELPTWRRLWSDRPDTITESSFQQYRRTAQRLLLSKAPAQPDPAQLVKHAWRDLPKPLKATLQPVRKSAEWALLRPQDLTAAWLDTCDLTATQREEIVEALHGLDDELAAVRAEAEAAATPSDPNALAWNALRDAARARGYATNRLSVVAGPAMKDGKSPRQLDREWAIQVSAGLTNKQNVAFREALRSLDEMRVDQDLAAQLYAKPIAALPDRRMRGKMEVPTGMRRELAEIDDALGRARSTHRTGRAVLRKLYTAAGGPGRCGVQTLEALLSSAPTLSGIGEPTRHKAALMLDDLRSVRQLLEDRRAGHM